MLDPALIVPGADALWQQCEQECGCEMAVIIPNATEDIIVTCRDNPCVLSTSIIVDVDAPSNVAAEVQQMLQVTASVVLRTFVFSSIKLVKNSEYSSNLTRNVYVVEPLEGTYNLPAGLQWTRVDECCITYFPAAGQRSINDELQIIATKRIPCRRVSFFRPGWVRKTELWLEELLRTKGMELEGPLEQVTMMWDSTVLQAVTNGGKYFVKQCAPHARDAAVTAVLREIASDLVAEPLYVDADSLLMVTADHGDGIGLMSARHSPGIIRRLCELHKASMPWISRLEEAGLHAYTADYLKENLEDLLFNQLGFLSDNKHMKFVKQNVHFLERAIGELERSDLPLVLVHGDLVASNVYHTGGPEGCYRFFDFDNSFIGNPLFDLTWGGRDDAQLYITGMGLEGQMVSDLLLRAINLLSHVIDMIRLMRVFLSAEDCVRVTVQECARHSIYYLASCLKFVIKKAVGDDEHRFGI